MNTAHNNSKAAAGAPLGGSARVRRLLACALLGCAALSTAHAGPRQRDQPREEYSRDGDQRQQPRQYDERQQPRQYDDRQQRQNDERAYQQARADEQHRAYEQQQQQQQQQQQSNDGRRNGRMTADERRDLRRQINEAGADLYPNQGRRR